MALRELVEGECGAANPLVKWTSHFSQEKSMLNVGVDHDRLREISTRPGISEEQLVDEFLGHAHQRQPAVPQTYNMGSLLQELQNTQQATPPSQLHPHVHQDEHVREWVQEFATPTATPLSHHAPPVSSPSVANEWASEFQSKQAEIRSAETEQWVREFAPSEEDKWVEEFQHQMGSELAAVAKEMTESITDPSIKSTEFMDFVKKLSTGEATLEDQKNEAAQGRAWDEEFLGEKGEQSNGGYWDRLEKEWDEMARSDQHPWLAEFPPTAAQSPPTYTFQEDNPLKEVDQPLEKGLERLAEGDLPSAVLLFEAEVQARPDSVRGWQLLGSTQADNEQDVMAIPALHRCLELDPGNLAAHMSLSVCYTNESHQPKVSVQPVHTSPALQAELRSYTLPVGQGKALECLRNWITHNPKYSSLAPPSAAAKPGHTRVGSFMSEEDHAEVKAMYIAAAQMSPDSIDCDVQVGLGVLFNLSSEYDKAVDCFTAALQVKPQDALLWNKLGATLANSSKSEQAVEAYRKALELVPGFTRARYNLGVSCMNLGAYKEAVEHFLTALNMQQQARTVSSSKEIKMSDSIWSTLKLAVSLSGRQDVLPQVDTRNLQPLLSTFGVI